jgi:hypothetical protein
MRELKAPPATGRRAIGFRPARMEAALTPEREPPLAAPSDPLTERSDYSRLIARGR